MAKATTKTKTKTKTKATGAGGRTSGRSRPDAGSGARLIVRHYCQGIGDCHLLGFPRRDGTTFWILIDCGVHSAVSGGGDFMKGVATDIMALTRGVIDVLVVTHEHTDHVSAFLSAKEVFSPLQVGEVWLAWTENPEDPQARELDRYKTHAMAALNGAVSRLAEAGLGERSFGALGAAVEHVLNFSMGAKGDKVRAARDAAIKLTKGPVRYFEPGAGPLPLPGVDGVRVYVLGPPRDKALLGVTERASEMYLGSGSGGSALSLALAGGMAAALGGSALDEGCPFEADVGTSFSLLGGAKEPDPKRPVKAALAEFAQARYFGDLPAPPALTPTGQPRRNGVDRNEIDQAWRRIDADWLGLSADLAMQLDQRTNNTSLVLAFEFVDTGRVALFAADAQVGNWLSWQDRSWTVDGKTVRAADLMARTVYLKVGHHGSHNATLRAKGLDLMTHPDLSAFVPVKATDAANVGWKEMPYGPILDALARACSGRVIRADDAWLESGKPPFAVPSGSIRDLRPSKAAQGRVERWVEIHLA
ncbi:hypothetical protein [uncultured Alsobacter sp.]|uniref:hypothetical protein n=1 Tax=uncultured Alsobacter sp. TaxID=1748258 RepID=UPI0025CC87F9|nr:hypothetical protein [uncultured Alsobacter sp.]